MINVRINYAGKRTEDLVLSGKTDKDDCYIIDTKMPKIPLNDDLISFYMDGKYFIGQVGNIVYQFDENNKFLWAEIHVSD